jgi:hypothetical protein
VSHESILSLIAAHNILRPIFITLLSVGAYAGAVMMARYARESAGELSVEFKRIVLALTVVAVILALVGGYGLVQSTFNPAMWAAMLSNEAAAHLSARGEL